MKPIEVIGQQAQAAAMNLRQSSAKDRTEVLRTLAQHIRTQSAAIVAANEKDLKLAREAHLSEAVIDRLTLNSQRIEAMAQGVEAIAQQPEVVGTTTLESQRADGLVIKRQRIPLGVIAMVFESRPNVIIDCAALAIKSANAIILKGGKEAAHSNHCLGQIVQTALTRKLSAATVQVLDSQDRQSVEALLKLNQYIDLMIPRGGQQLVEYVYANATMPVIAHFKGLCHIYIHRDAELAKAQQIVVNAKAQRPGVCNAMETLLLDRELGPQFVKDILQALQAQQVELRLDQALSSLCPGAKLANEADWATEYLDRILSIKQVDGVAGAIEHINRFGTRHTEAILAQDLQAIEQFKNSIDASCIMVNASTRFNDGGELGLGAEIGISTSKFHAYGPMGAAELTTTRFLVEGNGHIRQG